MYYKTCSICGDNLDPGEKCDCNSEVERAARYFENTIVLEKNTAQYAIKAFLSQVNTKGRVYEKLS